MRGKIRYHLGTVMDAEGFEPSTSRMQSVRATTVPSAHTDVRYTVSITTESTCKPKLYLAITHFPPLVPGREQSMLSESLTMSLESKMHYGAISAFCFSPKA